MSPQPADLRAQAAAFRHAADRLTLLRLRIGNSITELSQSEDEWTRDLGEQVHDRWTLTELPELGRLASGLRGTAKRLEQAAVQAERTTGRRLGGYAGAGFLGRGAEAQHHVHDVAKFVGTRHGAEIGGFPLLPDTAGAMLPHPSHTLGIETPDYEED